MNDEVHMSVEEVGEAQSKMIKIEPVSSCSDDQQAETGNRDRARLRLTTSGRRSAEEMVHGSDLAMNEFPLFDTSHLTKYR